MSSHLPDKTYFSISQAADVLGVSPDTLRRLEKKGKIKPRRGSGNKRLYSPKDIDILRQILNKPKEKRLYTPNEAAAILEVSVDTLRRWDKKGKIESRRTPGGQRRFTKKAIDAVKDTKYEPVEPEEKRKEKPESKIEIPPQPVVRVIPPPKEPLPLFIALLIFLALSLPLVGFSVSAEHLANGIKKLSSLYETSQDLELAKRESDRVLGVESEGGSAVTLAQVLDSNFNMSLQGYIEGTSLRSTTTSQPPLVVASTQKVVNLNVDFLDGSDWTDLPTLLTETSRDFSIGGNITVTGGNITLGTTSIFSGGDTAKLSNIDDIDSTTEDTFESALDFLRSDTSDTFSSGTLTLSDATLLDLSSIKHDDTGLQGIRLPQNTSLTSPSSGEGYIAWDTDDNEFKVFDGSSWANVSSTSLFTDGGDTTYLTSTTDKLALGATTSDSKLYVTGAVTGKALAIFDESGDQDILVASSSGTTRFVINNSGQLGIGTSSPSQAIDLIGALELEDTTTSTTGVVYKASNRFIHNFHHPTGDTAVPTGQNTFLGVNAGNFTMGSTATTTSHGSFNTVVGYDALTSNTIGHSNTAIGHSALTTNTSGRENTAIGYSSLQSNTTGYDNTAVGYQSLLNNETGYRNTAIGYHALRSNTGQENTALGYIALSSNTSGAKNSALGGFAAYSNTTGQFNTAVGFGALQNNSSGWSNTAVGYNALNSNTSSSNTAVGYAAFENTTGANNTGLGYSAGFDTTTGGRNIAIGAYALYENVTGNYNVIIGEEAARGTSGDSISNSTILGRRAGFGLTTGSNNILVGHQAGDNITSGANNILLGYDIDATTATTSNFMSLGNLIFATNLDGTGTTVSSGNVGIGTSNPTSKLHLTGAVTGKALAIFDETGDQNIFTASASGIPKFVIDNSGHVGVGTITPGGPLQIHQSGAEGLRLSRDSGHDTFEFSLVGADRLRIFNNSTSSELVSIMEGGSVGIGTDNPQFLLDVNGQARVNIAHNIDRDHTGAVAPPTTSFRRSNSSGLVSSGDWIGRLSFQGHDGGGFEGGAEIRAIVDGTPGTDDMPSRLEFAVASDGSISTTNTSPAMVIKNDGDVGIGRTNPARLLHVGPDSGTNVARISGDRVILEFEEVGVQIWDIDNDGGRFRIHSQDAGSVMELASSGQLFLNDLGSAASSTDLNINGSNEVHKVSSSKLYKDEIKSLSDRFDSNLVYDLKPRSFIWNENSGSAGMVDLGLVAEEVYETIPKMAALDADGKPHNIRWNILTTMLLSELQDFEKVIKIDSEGNVQIDGKLVTKEIQTDSLTTQDATREATLEQNLSQVESDLASLESEINRNKTRLDDVETKLTLLDSQQTINSQNTATDSAKINLDDATISSLTVVNDVVLGDTVINGTLDVGILSFDNLTGEINAIGPLKIQSLALDSVEFVGNSIEMDKSGNLHIKKGVIVGNEKTRGREKLTAGASSLRVKRDWDREPFSVVVTPSYTVPVSVSEISSDGFTINVENAPEEDADIHWIAIW